MALRINDASIRKTATRPIQMNYSVKFEAANFSKQYRATSVPVNPTSDTVEIFDALAMKVFNFEKVFDRNNNFIFNDEITVNVFGSISA